MKENKVHYKVGDWLFIPYEDKFILDGKDFLIEKRLSNLFVFLCQHPHQIFSRDELINEVWHGMILTDQVITQAIFELRKILKQNGEHPFGYIVTVSKRGYKLDSDVEVIEICNKPKPTPVVADTPKEVTDTVQDGLKVLEQDNHLITDNALSLPAEIPNKASHSKWKWLALVVLISFGLACSFFYVQQQHKTSLAKQTVAADKQPSYLSYEPRYIHVIYSPEMENHRLASGFTMYLFTQLKSYKDFRVLYQGEVAESAANVMNIDITNVNDTDYLTIEFNNRITGSKHLSRKYEINENGLHRALSIALDDLLDSFDINVSKDEISARIAELPTNADALHYALNGFSVASRLRQDGEILMNLSRSLQIEPDNQYIYSSNYMLSLANLYLLREQSMDDAIARLNHEHESTLKQFYVEDVTSYRTLEALAMLSLSRDLPLNAKKYLQEIPYNQRSIFYYITSAKVSEALGDNLTAEEHYYQAILDASSFEVLPISETLFFDSSLTHIKDKIEASEI